MSVRVRFAPSPTGYLHIGGARTALFNWLFAKKHGGKFILRIEDTDQKRSVPGAIDAIIDSLHWLGLDWDEGPDVGGPYGPYIQTERATLYRHWADWLVENGFAYKCFCTPDELDQMRKTQRMEKLRLGYDGRCRNLSTSEIRDKELRGNKPVVRFRMRQEGTTVIPDVIRGAITYDNTQITDAVLLKSDGLPTYHLANVIDDHFMEITHILRADEWISTAPLHINLYEAFGWQHPTYAHLSLVLNPSGKGKLSKRNQKFEDDGFEVLVRVEEFQQAGLLPKALVNFLANIGWSSGDDKEKFTLDEIIPRIELENFNPAPSRLPYPKLDWLNGQYIQEMSDLDLAKAIRPFLINSDFEVNVDSLLAIMPSIKIRLKRLTDAVDLTRFLFNDDTWSPVPQKLTHKELSNPIDTIKRARKYLSELETYSLEGIGDGLRLLGEQVSENGKPGPLLSVLRYAVTGQDVSPPLFDSIVALGKARTISRLDHCIALLGNGNDTT